jgi:hypothetical protein
MDEVYELQRKTQENIGDSVDDQSEQVLLTQLDELQGLIVKAQLE